MCYKVQCLVSWQHENRVTVGKPRDCSALNNHASDEAQDRLAKIQNTMKTLAANTRDKPRQSLAQALGQCDDDVRALIPNPNAIKCTLCN